MNVALIALIVWAFLYGEKHWYRNGKRHREDGPAIEHAGGKSWYREDKLHREDGPARELANGYKEWYRKGKQLSEEEFNRSRGEFSCKDKVVEIEGKKYKLVEV